VATTLQLLTLWLMFDVVLVAAWSTWRGEQRASE